jgi:nicotinate phosphoribosyltransferase
MAHSWVMSFPNEEEAFDAYAEIYPEKSVFLIDTYDTLKSGMPSAIKSGKKLGLLGKNFGVRLDSGDIQYLSTEARKLLDDAGLKSATITVSNDLDEYIIETLVKSGSPVDVWGVGTNLVTGGGDGAFSGVYKIAACEGAGGPMKPVMKISDNPGKATSPGIKQVWRIKDKNGFALADVLALDENGEAASFAKGQRCRFWHPSADYRHFAHTMETAPEPLLKPCLVNGKPIRAQPALDEIRAFCEAELETFDATYKRLLNPHIYKVSITEKLRGLKLDFFAPKDLSHS